MGVFAKLMANMLQLFHDLLGVGWGWSIILLTFLIKIILFPTSLSQLRSMEGMKKIQPLQKKIQEKYKKNPEELQRKMMELYKTHKVNPLGGCLPMLIQIPFIWALFRVLNAPQSYNLDMADATFLGMNLLSSGYLLLGIVSGATTFLQQKMTPAAGAEASQSAMLYVMPVFFGWITYTLTAGVGLYWVTSTVFGIAQQWVVTRYFLSSEQQEQKGDQDEDKPKPKGKNSKL